MNELIAQLNESASAIAEHGHNGWGNLMINAAEELSKFESERDKLQADYNKAMADVAMMKSKIEWLVNSCDAEKLTNEFISKHFATTLSSTADSEAWLADYRKKVLEEVAEMIDKKYTANESIWICGDIRRLAASKRKEQV